MILALTEHLQKIPYLLSLYLPVALFFLAGLALAWILWYKHSRRLHYALAKHESLTAELADCYQKDYDLGNSFKQAMNQPQIDWQSQLNEKQGQLTLLSGKLEQSKGQVNQLGGELDQSKVEVERLKREKAQDAERVQTSVTKIGEEISALQGNPGGNNFALAGAGGAAGLGAIGAATFLGHTDAKEDPKFGFLYPNKPTDADDLTKISGIGDTLQSRLNKEGIYQFKQIALWSQDNIDSFSTKLNLSRNIENEQWIPQATDLHRKHHGENLAPIVNIYQKDLVEPATTSFAAAAGPTSTSSTMDYFTGEPVRNDTTLGVLYYQRPSEIDDLKKIHGVAEVLEKRLHEFGLFRFKQIALWTDEQVNEFSERLSFPGRIERDEWVKQATQFHAEKYGRL